MSNACGTIDVTISSASLLGTLSSDDSYIVQVAFPEELVAKADTSSRTGKSSSAERGTVEWSFKKSYAMKQKITKESKFIITLLQHRLVLSDIPCAVGECNLWPLWKGEPVEQVVLVKAVPPPGATAESVRPANDAAKVKIRLEWKGGIVPDLDLSATRINEPAGAPKKPGEYDGASKLDSATSLPNCENNDYRVHVRIHKARNLQSVKANKLYDPIVEVTVGDVTQRTDYVKETNNPLFDEELVFPFAKVGPSFWQTAITVSVLDHYIGGFTSLIGAAQMDCGTVYREDQHFAMNKWYVLHEGVTEGRVKGFLKCSIAVLNQRTDHIPEQEDHDEDEDDIVSNLVSGPNARFEEVSLDCDIFRAEDLPKMDIDFFGKPGKADPYVKIKFGTKKVKTEFIKDTQEPVWNKSISLPLLLPALTQMITVSMWDHDYASTNDVIATSKMSIDDLIRAGGDTALPRFDAQWLNFYGHPRNRDSGGIFNSWFKRMAFGDAEGCDYRGRLLLRMNGNRANSGSNGRPPSEVTQTQVTVTVNVQVLSVAMIPSGDYKLRVGFGLNEVFTNKRSTADMKGCANAKFILIEEELRVTGTFSVVVPTSDSPVTVESQLPDIIVSIVPVSILRGNEDPYAYARFPVKMVWNKPATTHSCVTLKLLSDPNKISEGSEPEMPLIQLAVSAFPTKFDPVVAGLEAHKAIQMPAITSDTLAPYMIEAAVFHAKQLPAGDDNGLSDPYVRVYFANGVARSGYKLETLSPQWNELLRVMADLRPTQTFPDIILEVWDRDFIGSDTFLGRRLVSIDDATADDLVAVPRWYTDFTDSRGQPVAGCHVLASFELIKLTAKNMKEPPQQTFFRKIGHGDSYVGFSIPEGKKLSTSSYKISVDLLGLRHMRKFRLFDVSRPSVAVDIGMQRVAVGPIHGTNPSINKQFDMFAEMPMDPQFLPELSFRIYDHRLGTKQLVGCAYLLLSDERCNPTLNYRRDERLKAECTDRLNKIIKFKEGEPVEAHDAVVRQRPTFKRTAQAIAAMAGKHLVAEARGEEVPAPPSIHRDENLDQPLLPKPSAHAIARPENPASFAGLDNGEQEELKSLDEDEYQELWFDRFKPPEGSAVRASDIVTRLGKLGAAAGLDPGKTTAEDYFGPFDDYNRLVLRRGWGSENAFAGEVLVNALITRVEDAPRMSSPTGKKDEVPIRDIIGRRPVSFLARVYILSCSKLTAKDTGIMGGSSDPYIKLKLSSYSSAVKEEEVVLKDSIKHGTLEPAFFLHQDVNGVLPKHNTLIVTVMDYDKVGWDEEIGFTIINLEDRWYSKRGYSGGAAKTYFAPGTYTEKRTLKNEVGQSQGTIELWVDLFDVDNKVEIPRPIDITPPPPIELEMRCVVWNTRDVQLLDENFAGEILTDIYVRCWVVGMEHDIQQTDVHYRSLDGTGNFNWRMNFPFTFDPRTSKIYPIKSDGFFSKLFSREKEPKMYAPTLMVQIFDNEVLPIGDDFIGEAQLRLDNLIPVSARRYAQKIGPMESCCPCPFFPFNMMCMRRKEARFLTLEEKQTLGRDEQAYEMRQRKDMFDALAEERMAPYRDAMKANPAAYSTKFLEKLKKKFERDAMREHRVDIFKTFQPRKEKKRKHRHDPMLGDMVAEHDDHETHDHDYCDVNMDVPKVIETPKYWFACRAPDGGYRSGDVQISFQLVRKDELDKDEKLAAGKGRSDPHKLPEPQRPADSFFWLSSPAKSAYYILWRHYKWYIITTGLIILSFVYLFLFTQTGLNGKANKFFGNDEPQQVVLLTPQVSNVTTRAAPPQSTTSIVTTTTAAPLTTTEAPKTSLVPIPTTPHGNVTSGADELHTVATVAPHTP